MSEKKKKKPKKLSKKEQKIKNISHYVANETIIKTIYYDKGFKKRIFTLIEEWMKESQTKNKIIYIADFKNDSKN